MLRRPHGARMRPLLLLLLGALTLNQPRAWRGRRGRESASGRARMLGIKTVGLEGAPRRRGASERADMPGIKTVGPKGAPRTMGATHTALHTRPPNTAAPHTPAKHGRMPHPKKGLRATQNESSQ